VDIPAVLASVIVTTMTVGGGYVVARRFQKLGGGEAQERLNAIRKELDDAMEDKVRVLEERLKGANGRIVALEGQVKRLRDERIDLKQEIADLHDELRTLRPDRRGHRDRSDD
jgi:predicted  nucleic acid-binding Zn-ribbon protein